MNTIKWIGFPMPISSPFKNTSAHTVDTYSCCLARGKVKQIVSSKMIMSILCWPFFAEFGKRQGQRNALVDVAALKPLQATYVEKQQLHDKIFAEWGEIPQTVLRQRHATPTTLTGEHIYAKLHGNNIKLFCSLGVSTSRPGELLEAVARPFLFRNQGGWRELVAFHVDRATGLFKIPNEVLEQSPRNVEIKDWGANFTDFFVIQSYIKNVSLVFVQDWLSCLPDPPSTPANRPIKVHTLAFKGQTFRTTEVFAVRESQLTICPRNMAVFDAEWGDQCTKDLASKQICTQGHISQIMELLLFDFLIANGERLHPKGRSNNVHAHQFAPDSRLELLFIDQGHYSFDGENQVMEEYKQTLTKYCIFPGRYLAQLGEIKGNASDLIKASMGEELVRHYEQSQAHLSKDVAKKVNLQEMLSVVDKHMHLLGNILTECA